MPTKLSCSKNTDDPDLITGKELAARLSITQRQLGELRRKRIVPYIKFGHRSILYPWDRVVQSLARLEVRAVGDKK